MRVLMAAHVPKIFHSSDALGAHSRDELGISDTTAARPVQAALTSAASFSIGAALPLLVALATPEGFVVPAVSIASLLFLALLGMIGAKTGGSNMSKAAARVTFWGALAMIVTAAVGAMFGTHV